MQFARGRWRKQMLWRHGNSNGCIFDKKKISPTSCTKNMCIHINNNLNHFRGFDQNCRWSLMTHPLGLPELNKKLQIGDEKYNYSTKRWRQKNVYFLRKYIQNIQYLYSSVDKTLWQFITYCIKFTLIYTLRCIGTMQVRHRAS